MTGLLWRLRASFGARCGWCGAGHRRDDRLTTSLVFQPGQLYHLDCARFVVAHLLCWCSSPTLSPGDPRFCGACGKRLGGEPTQAEREAFALLAARPWGDRNVWTYARFQKALYREGEAEWLRSR